MTPTIAPLTNSSDLLATIDRDRFFPNGRDSNDILRFLKARNNDVQAASTMYKAHIEWRKQTLPIPYEDVKETLASQKFYVLPNTDKDGRPILYYNFRKFMEHSYIVEDEIKALLYVLEEQVIPMMNNTSNIDAQKWKVIIDVSGIRSPPLSFLKQLNEIMEANYPERLDTTVMLPVPHWLQTIIKGCMAFVDEETRSKFVFCNDLAALEKYATIPLDQLGPDLRDLVDKGQLAK